MTETQLQALRQIAANDGCAPKYRLSEVQIRACSKAGLAMETRYGVLLTFKGRAALAEVSSDVSSSFEVGIVEPR